ncbi:hypothetical protein KDW_59720 [Dictyobacter vulcani]|uniref:Pyrrolo-quinoline quinone repeat domain-containing protein n=1 Tax=Dictyobacter vulcani TaxID=2607529 RepID=A0A5J4KZ43_9CHLR|nr:PQQ-binding-like beta-propeller repeat protein [Dictyobacter vulcani]GER91810.1 hypothetical protein KDW_59720 [Dictyobacter vulcani]
MNHHDEYFQPDTIDEQTSQSSPSQIQDPVASELTEMLRHIYHPTVTREDQDSLAQIKQRLHATKTHDATSAQTTIPTGSDQPITSWTKNFKTHQHNPKPPASKRKRIPILNTLAATLLVGLLIGSWFAATHLLHPIVSISTSGHTIPTSTVASEPGNIYEVFNNTLTKLDGQTGTTIWSHKLTSRQSTDARNTHFIVQQDTVYAMLEHDLYAFAANTGQQLWHTETQYSANFIPGINNNAFYIYQVDGTSSAYTLSDGQLLWHNTTKINSTGFNVSNAMLYIKESSNHLQGGLPAIILHALDARTGKQRWQFTAWGSTGDTQLAATVFDGIAYFTPYQYLYALDEQTGKKLWEQKTMDQWDFFTHVETKDGVTATDTNSVQTLVGCPMNNPECNGKDTARIAAFDSRTGHQLWQSDTRFRRLPDSSNVDQLDSFGNHQAIPITNNILIGYYRPAPQKNTDTKSNQYHPCLRCTQRKINLAVFD